MSVGFRPTPEDTEIIRAHQRPDESTSDVLRRALRALDRERWEQEARSDMERIAADGEDLADEPDEWGYDDTGTAVDLRATQGSSRLDFQSWSEMRLGNSRAAVPSSPLRKDTFSPLLRRLTSQSPLAGVAGGNVMHAFK
ncbi:hypothetical protein ACM9HD_33100, partial [Streptomyces sp. JAC25]|uniref:hypothetical protein n=1 Tax=Streptomyces sp. JAC25 TaxID=3418413 RepID=UPI003D817C6F